MNQSQPPPLPGGSSPLLRILDANQNRASEALRVIEDYARFALDDASLAGEVKDVRHRLVAALSRIPGSDLLQSRETAQDVGTELQAPAEYQRRDLVDVVLANLRRAEQSLRTLEEYGKVLSPEIGQQLEQLRYATYQLGKVLGAAVHRPRQLADARLYVLMDGGHDETAFLRQAEALVAAGVPVIQLRDKRLNDRELLQRARVLRQITRGKTLLIINDRPDLAVLADADGVHVGQEELSVKDARTVVGPRTLIGVSTHSIDQARQAVRDGADYIGCGPTFPSQTKSFGEFPGLNLLREVAAEIRLPAFAIGGIELANLDQVQKAGFTRVAVSGAIANADDPAAAAQAFLGRLATATS